MADKKIIKIGAEIEPTLKGMNEVVQKLQEGLSKGSAQIDFTKGAGKNVSKLFDTFTNEYKRFQSLTKDGILNATDSKKAIQSGEKIISTFRDLQRIVGDFSSLTLVDAKKLFPEAFDKRVDSARQALNGLLSATQRLNSKKIELDAADAEVKSLTNKVSELQKKITNTSQLKIDTNAADDNLKNTKKTVDDLRNSLREIYGTEIASVAKELSQAQNNLTSAKNKVSKGITTRGSSVYYEGQTREEWKKDKNSTSQKKTEALIALDNYNKANAEIKELETNVTNLQKKFNTLNSIITNLDADKLDKIPELMRSLQGEQDVEKANELSAALKQQTSAAEKAKEAHLKLDSAEKSNSSVQADLDKTNNKLAEQTRRVQVLREAYNNLSNGISFENLQKALSDVGVEVDKTDLQTADGLKKIRTALDGLDNQKLEILKISLKSLGASADQVDTFIDKFRSGLDQASNSVRELTDRQRDIERLTYQIKYFFSITNSVRLFKRAVRSAFQTVKELDSAMTKIAVVSDFSVGDMWERLPEFTAQANELGVAIKDTYNATALYIQQGLDLQHSMELSNETLKMARIAGIEAADATDAMTSALRGFNMELNQTSAQRVNDVYSELAAITASNVEELSTAMSKTASIAHSVNMEFETTAAFLAQGIETTRESAETIGTMLKTVIGRFSEVKSLYSKGEITSTDENGEEINVNKVQKALRAAGVDMTKFFTGEEGLDQVFLNLSKKWDSLDITTQRYIATLAAGSRQQSRFLAIISDYSKTMELVNAANNSAGASQEQYEKTLESLASKLAKLKNAWDEFAMGLANNEVIKVAVDTLTTLLQTINKILDTVSGGSGVLKSTLSILTAIGALKLGKSLLFTGIGKMVDGREGGLAGRWFGKKKEQQNTGYSAGIQTGKGFINGFESITKTFKSKGGRGFVQSIFSSKITPTDLSKVLNLNEWNLDFSNVDTKKAATFIASDLNKQISSHPELESTLNNMFNKTGASSNIELYRQELGKLNLQMEMTGQQAQDMGISVYRTVPNFRMMAIATGAAAAALMSLGAYLKTTGEGGEKAGKVIQGFGTMLMGLIPIISMVQTAMIAGAESVSVAIKNIPIIGWIAAIISAVISLIQIISAVAPETQEEKLKRLSEQTQQAAEAAKEAQQAYKDLQESFDKYSDAADKIKKLTVGTTEWKEALLEVNAEVLSLLEKYPQLSKSVISENGVMSIRPEGIQDILDQALQTSYSAQALQISNDFVKTSYEKQGVIEYFSSDSIFNRKDEFGNISLSEDAPQLIVDYFRKNPHITEEEARGDKYDLGDIQELISNNPKELDRILKQNGIFEANGSTWADIQNSIVSGYITSNEQLENALKSVNIYDGLYKFNDEINKISDATGVASKNLVLLAEDAKKYNQDIDRFAIQQENYKRGISILAGSNSEQEYWNDALNIIDLDKTAEKIEQTGKDLDRHSLVDIADQLNKQGAEIVTSGETDEIRKSVYEALTGDTSGTKTESEMNSQIAQYKVMKEQVKEVGDVAEKLSKIDNKEMADEIAGRLSHGKGLTRTQAEGEISFEAMATAMGYDKVDDMAIAFGFGNESELEKAWTEEAAEINRQFDQIETDVISVIGEAAAEQAERLMGDQTFETYSNYLDQLSVLFIRSGDEGAKAVEQFQNAFEQILNGLSDEDKKKVQEIVGNIDFSNYDSVTQALEDIKEVAPNSAESLEEMKGAVIELGKASKKVDLKGALSSVTDALNLADDIASRDKSEGITQEELEKIVSSGAADYSDFIFTGQEFIPVEDSMDNLAEAIRNNSLEVIKNTQALLQSSIRSGEVLESAFNSDNWGNISDEQKNRILSGNADMNLGDAEVLRNLLGMSETDSNYAVMSAYNAHIFDYLNLADNRAQDEAYTNYADQMKAFQLDPQEQLDQGGAYLKERVEAEQLTGVQDKLIENYNKTGKAVDENSKLMQAHTVQYAQSERKIKSLCETVKDVKDAFDAGTEALKNNEKPSEDYYKALEKIAERGKQVFGESFTKEFVEENADLISQLSEGGEIGEQAFISLQQKISEATQQAVEDLTYFDTNLQQVRSVLDGLDGVKAEFKVNGTADVSQLVQQLILAGNTAAEAARIVESLTGSTVTYTVDWQWVTLPTSLAMSSTYAGLEKAGASGGFTSVKIPKVIQAVGTKNNYSGSGYSGSSSGGGGGGSSSKDTVWENPYDKLYNLTEQINEALRQREKLEREYDRILERRGSTFKELRANHNAQVKSLEEEIKLQEKLRAGRKGQLDAISNEKYTDSEGNRKTFAQTGATRYAQYDQNLNRIIIDWNAIDMITDDDLGSAVEAYVSRLEELQDQFEEVDKTVEDMQDTINELKKSQMQDYLDFEQSVYDALVNAQQKLIDEYQSLSDSIADSNSKILDNLQESIDLERQIRDNTKTEEDINEKEARLAFLRRDTSNANALEIKQLEEELSDARQDYSDSLIDQQLDRLSKQNDDAQEAREKQIELMQAQLDYASENGEFWNQAYELINDGFSSDGSLNQASQLWDLLKADQGWNGLSKFGQLNWQEEISKAIIAASQGYANWNMYKAEQVDKSLVLPDGTQLTYDGTNWKDSQGNVYKDVDFNSNKNQFEYGSIDYVKPAPTPETGGSGSSSEPEKKEISIGSSFNASGAPIYSYPGSSAQRQYFANDPYYVAIGEMGDYWMARWHGASSGVTGFFKKSDVRAYKTGGLADFTGPAWLDGSKTKPELVLNARDTENFLLLKDVLGSFLKNNMTTQNGKGGDNYYDIDISVDEIGSDYDVDQLARRIKEQITEDSTYRNVNAINFIR